MNQPALKLHGFPLSGHAHRVELFLSLLGLPFEHITVDLPNNAHKTPAFLAMNSFGQVPVLEDGDITLADSNAILVYLAVKYGGESWLPRDALGAARVQRWLSVAAGPLAFGPAAARLIALFNAPLGKDEVTARAHELFAVMETELGKAPYFAGNAPTIADVALYAYTAHAPEGGVSLSAYPGIRDWLARIEALPGFVPMVRSPLPAAA